MGTFVNVSRQEMADFLIPQGFREIKIPNTVEIVFAKRVHQDNFELSLRIYTGINPTGVSRGVGEDAIRVCLFIRNDGLITKLSGDKRVNRTTNWRKNLQLRLDRWLENMPAHRCSCGMPMIPRKGKNGTFLGCSTFPRCKETRALRNEQHD